MTAFALTDHTHVYPDGTVALDELTLSVTGRALGLLGPNGAGKTTVLQLLATTLRPSGGTVDVLDTTVDPTTTRSHLRALRRQIGYLPQSTPVLPRFSALDQVTYACWLRDVNPRDARQQAANALDRVGLSDLYDRRTSRLSGGQQRRVALAMAIAHSPKLLLLDEPTTGLDPEQRIALRRLLADLTADVTVVISTHHTDDIAAMCDSVAVITTGATAFIGDVADLETRGRTSATDAMATPLEAGYLDVLPRS